MRGIRPFKKISQSLEVAATQHARLSSASAHSLRSLAAFPRDGRYISRSGGVTGSMDEASTIGWARRLRDDAFERLFRDEYPRAVAIARRVLGATGEAEDAALDAFTAFHRRYEATVPFARAWLGAAAANGALNRLRSQRRRLEREAAQARSADAGSRESEREADPQRLLERAESVRYVRLALAALAPRDAAALTLRASGLRYRELAGALGVDPRHVGTILARAARSFQREIISHASR